MATTTVRANQIQFINSIVVMGLIIILIGLAGG